MNTSDEGMFAEICRSIVQNWPREKWRNIGIVLAVSGGPDSVLLLRVVAEVLGDDSRNHVTVAHYNHGTRESADGDQRFVEQLASDFGLACVTGNADPKENHASEDSLRRERYAFLASVANQKGARYILAGHHRDDQIETILFRLFRGTGFNGLKGIPMFREIEHGITIVRPLLSISRRDIASALEELGQMTRIDESNLSDVYARNNLRQNILPLIRDSFGNVDESVLRLSRQASLLDDFLTQISEPLAKYARQPDPNRIEIETTGLANQHPVVVTHLLLQIWTEAGWPRQGMSKLWWDRLTKLVQSSKDEKAMTLPGNIRATATPAGLVILVRSDTGDV